ncbi:MAG: hypothetical protein IH602_09140 [Bryobacteraceae bacterium]|nr:hypothetical protein [Bryobacteraceae bacterium]
MNCEDAARILLDDRLDALEPGVRLDVERHCASCSGCKALMEMMAEVEAGSVPPALAEKTFEIVQAPLDAGAPAPASLRFALLTVLAMAVVAGLALTGLGLKGLRAMTVEQAWGLLSLLAFCGVAGWFAIDGELRPGSGRRIKGGAALLTLGASYVAVVAVLAGSGGSAHLLRDAVFCFAVGSCVSMAMYWVLRRISRWGYALHPTGVGLAMGSLSALAGLVVLQMFCPKNELDHLLLGHGLALAAGVAFALRFEQRRAGRG